MKSNSIFNRSFLRTMFRGGAMVAALTLTACVVTTPDGEPSTSLKANAGEDVVVVAESPVTLTGSATGGQEPYIFRWTLAAKPEESTLDLEEGVLSDTLGLDPLMVDGEYVFRIRVTDGVGTTDTSFVTVLVGGKIIVTVEADDTLRIVGQSTTVTATTDVEESQDVTFSWEVISGEAEFDDPKVAAPQVTIQSNSTVVLQVTATSVTSGLEVIGIAEVVIVGVDSARPRVRITNSGGVSGDIVIELFTDITPNTCANYLRYVDDEFFDGVVWHRVVADFIIQGGAFTSEDGGLVEKEGIRDTIKSEALNGESNLRSFISMALRGDDADSATNQWFINHSDNIGLDDGSPPFTVFAQVVEGMDVVDEIAQVPVGTDSNLGFSDVPIDPVVMATVRRVADE